MVSPTSEATWRYRRTRYLTPVGALAVLAFFAWFLGDYGTWRDWWPVLLMGGSLLLVPPVLVLVQQLRAPQEISIESGVVIARWRTRELRTAATEVVVHRRPSLLLDSAIEVETPIGRYAVFDDIEGFEGLVAALEQAATPSQDASA